MEERFEKIFPSIQHYRQIPPPQKEAINLSNYHQIEILCTRIRLHPTGYCKYHRINRDAE